MAERRDAAPGREDFARAVGALRPALKLHCYRMLGSLQDAEDAVQETLAGAWGALDAFEARSSLKTWLYRIATNQCLNRLKARARRRRYLPEQIGRPAASGPDRAADPDFPWLQPYPDDDIEAVADPAPGPLARYEARESVRLAFVAAVQRLPPRQRVALLFVDVMGWSVAEVATTLGASNAAINSALQRARATMRASGPASTAATGGADQLDLAERYARAWESRDLEGFIGLLKADAVYSMPPRPQWYAGRAAIRRVFAETWPAYGAFRLVAARANGGPAFGLYAASPGESVLRPHSLHTLALDGGEIAALHLFMRPVSDALFPAFGLPSAL